MDKITKRFFYIITVITLTIFTQVGGIIWLICFPTFGQIREKVQKRWKRLTVQTLFFFLVYTTICSAFIPFVARQFGKEHLPVFNNEKLKPLNLISCWMNRHYVTPLMLKTLEKTANEFEQKYDGGIITYLDGNFPFFTGFPLLPHRSHDDGEKVDLAFFYINTTSQLPMYGESVTAFGYGIFEKPTTNEMNMPQRCANKGAWQYDAIKYFATNRKRHKMKFDAERTQYMIQLLNKKNSIKKIFIEPHLKHRLGFDHYKKVRFHGCRAVRHDDHLHIQL